MNRPPIHILLVDDDADDRQFFCEAIHEIDPQIIVHISIDGIEAIQYLHRTPHLPGYIFLDMNMPRLNGLQTLKEIKSNGMWQHIPVIMYSTSQFKQEQDLAFQNGASRFVQKPSSFSAICKVLAKIIK